ncbi:GIY-YIG nuclease family protein [Lactococcus nasutitermitis]|uniref:GIY-YIG nuclease family protein n=1 Tax=Lactococcus nasutitermitis TaxID=1652957 RepID=A0ABV9JA05_9LACT|nr:GIY-YIG nuclease family protein [Lactococcus nasutitermitis]
MNNPILLKDLLNFDALLRQYSNRRIKLRFNKDWGNEEKWYSFESMYLNDDPDFEHWYQNNGNGKTARNRADDIQFSFIELGNGSHKWLLIDAYLVLKADNGNDQAEIKRLEEYVPYFGRLIVDWKSPARNWWVVNQEAINAIEISDILSVSYKDKTENFPGYENIIKSYSELNHLIDNSDWKTALSRIYGVYVLTDKATGKLYVGSATGDAGIYGRWKTYLTKGLTTENEYINKELKALWKESGIKYIQDNFQFKLLEIFQPNEIGRKKALERENHWKEVLDSRQHGYNSN